MNNLSRCQPLLGTYVEIELQAEASDQQLIEYSQAAFAAIERVEAMMSFHRQDSELSNINRHAHLQVCPISPEMYQVLAQALALSELSAGLFDISIAPSLIQLGGLPPVPGAAASQANWQAIELSPSSIAFKQPLLLDLGGIAKGYAVDRAMAAVPDEVQLSINAGGDLRLSHWQGQQTAVRLPSKPSQTVALPMMASAIATSANYFTEFAEADSGAGPDAEPASAMIMPATGEPIVQDYSISVYADNCMLADALTKWAFLDLAAGAKIRDLNALAVMVTADGQVTAL